MSLDFLPFTDGQVTTAANLNALVAAIQDGTIFVNTTYISEQLSLMSQQVISLTSRVNALQSLQDSLSMREQFILTAGQSVVQLSQIPILDTELLFINGISISKTGIPLNYSGSYTISGKVITLNTQLASIITSTDEMAVQYRYGV